MKLSCLNFLEVWLICKLNFCSTVVSGSGGNWFLFGIHLVSFSSDYGPDRLATSLRSQYSSVVQRCAKGWMVEISSPGRGWEFFSSPPRPDWLWSPPSLLYNGYYQGLWGWSGRGVKLTTHLHLVPRSRMRGAIPPLPQYAFMAWCSVKKAQGQLYLYL
jgi:hypothetical protein